MKMPKLSLYSKWRLVFVVAVFFASSAMLPLSGLFTRTANAAPTAAECYALNGLPYNKNLVAGPLNPNREKQEQCIDAGYCQEGAGNLATGIICTEDVYKASDQYKTTQANNDADTILNSQIAPLITVVCGSPSTNTQADAEYADCASKVKTQYKVCHDAALNHSEDVASSVSTCMNSWTQATYPSKKIKKDAITSAVGDGVVKGTEKATEISKEAQEKAETDCEAKGATYDPDSEDADDDGCVTPVAAAPCTAGALGWIMCPTVYMFQSLIEWVGGYIDNVMTIQPLLNTDSGARIQEVWRIFVGFANLALIVAFLIVIFSQATSVGLSAYGIKKMLPRIIAAAILINASFFLCAIAVDITNILAGSVKDVIHSVMINIPSDSISPWDIGQGIGANIGLVLGGLIGFGLAAMGYVAFLVPALVTAGLAMVAIFFGIALRQVLVYVLIFIAPLAFAAMILPNTEPMFTKWRKLFMNMLLMYPVIMFMLYGSGLVAAIILASKGGTESTPIDIIAFLAASIGPFAGMFMYIKNSNKLMSMAAGTVSKMGSGLQGVSKGWAQQKQKNSTLSQIRERRNAAITMNAQRRSFGRMGKGLTGQLATAGMNDEQRRILTTRINDANEAMSKETTEAHAKHLGAVSSQLLAKGYVRDSDGTYSHAASKTKGMNAAALKAHSGHTLDVAADNEMTYAAGQDLMQNQEGRRAIMQTLYQTKNADFANIKEIINSANTADEAAALNSFNTNQAFANGFTHLAFNTVNRDPKTGKGVFVAGGAKGGVGGVVEKLTQDFPATPKEAFGDPALSADLAAYMRKVDGTDSFAAHLTKMNEGQFREMEKLMEAQNGGLGVPVGFSLRELLDRQAAAKAKFKS